MRKCKKACFTFKDWAAATVLWGCGITVIGLLLGMLSHSAYLTYYDQGFQGLCIFAAMLSLIPALVWAVGHADKRF